MRHSREEERCVTESSLRETASSSRGRACERKWRTLDAGSSTMISRAPARRMWKNISSVGRP
eukprot:4245736-Prymnesium_polylepis.2